MKYYVIYNSELGGYYCEKGVKSFWDTRILKADKFMTIEEAQEAAKWFPKVHVEIKQVTLNVTDIS